MSVDRPSSDEPAESAASGGELPFEVPESTETALIGQVIGGRYQVEKLIGCGGFGSVFLSTHTTTGQKLVVKVLRAEMASDPVQVKRFFNEAKTTCQLTHPHTVSVFDFGRTDMGQLFMAMEFLDGEELAVVLKREAPLDPLRVTRIACAILKSLAEAHDAGLVHRDLKPGNVFLCNVHGNRDFVKLIDFGIAKSYEAGEDEDLTKTGFAIGTPKYMSPEQVRGEPLDGRSDLYSLSVMMYEALCGSVPFKASSAMGLIVKHMQEAPVDIAEQVEVPLPAGLSEAVMKGLAKTPWERFSDADDMRAALEQVLAASGQPVPPETRATSAKMRALEPAVVAAALAVAGAESDEPTVAVEGARRAKPEAATLALDTGEARALATNAAAGTAPDTAEVAPADNAEATEELAGIDPVTGLETRIQRGLNQSSIVPSTPGRPSRNRSKYQQGPRRREGGGYLLPFIGLIFAVGAGWLIWNVVQGRDLSVDLLERQATALFAGAESTIREPTAAPKGQREVEMPRLPKASVKKRAAYEKKVEARYEGVGDKGEPLSSKEIDAATRGVLRSLKRCFSRHGDRKRTYPSVPIAIEVNPEGKVVRAVLNKEIGAGALAKCVEGVAKTMKLRGGRPGLEAHVAYAGIGPVRKPSRRKAHRTAPKWKTDGDKPL